MGEEQSPLKAATDRLWGCFSAVSLALVAYTFSSELAVVVSIALATLLLAWYRGKGTSEKAPE